MQARSLPVDNQVFFLYKEIKYTTQNNIKWSYINLQSCSGGTGKMLSVCNLWDFFSWAFAFSWSRQIVSFTYFSCKKHENWKVFTKKVCGCIKNLCTNFPQTNQTNQQQPPSKEKKTNKTSQAKTKIQNRTAKKPPYQATTTKKPPTQHVL